MKTLLNDAASNKDFAKFYQKRIEEFETDTLNSYFSHYTVEDRNTTVIKFNLERAVLQYTSYFNKYTKETDNLDSRHFILDLTHTLFLDSTFLGAIVGYYKQLQKNGRTLKLVMDYQKLTIITLIDSYKRVFKIYPSVDEAINDLKIE